MLMPRALWLLKFLELRGALRRFARQLKRPAGLVLLLVYVCIFAPGFLNAYLRGDTFELPPEWILRGGPLIIGAMCLLTLLTPGLRFALHFKPAEVDVLFTGPYSRRHLITYKLFGNMSGALFMSLVTFVASLAFMPAKLPVFAGMFLAFLFTFLFSALYGMFIQALTSRVRYLGWIVAAIVLASVAFIVFLVLRDVTSMVGGARDPSRVLSEFFDHHLIKAISFPFMPFAHVMVGGPILDHLFWMGICAIMIVAEYVLIIWLDADYMESAIVRSARHHEALERFKRGQSMSYGAVLRRRRWTLPSLPYWGGFGPVAWRQLLGAFHVWARTLLGLAVVCLAGGMIVLQYDVSEDIRDLSLPALMGVSVYLSLLVTNLFRFDFRSEIDSMDQLKTMPASSFAIAAAELVAPTVTLTAIYLVLAVGTAIAMQRPEIVGIVLLISPPFAMLLMAIENFVFLTWPARVAHRGNMDSQQMARTFLGLLVKFLIMVPAGAVAVGVALACGFILKSWLLAWIAASWILTLEAALMLPVVAHAYDKFDPSVDTPP
ncbi:MAG TPA: putative ABC exporter domain-containing protein [Candidatus Hydrogenedentes bacterium]|nr:putative ABC exporter domain-containing protein [Candidatus Hydrogenedentota bacterium]